MKMVMVGGKRRVRRQLAGWPLCSPPCRRRRGCSPHKGTTDLCRSLGSSTSLICPSTRRTPRNGHERCLTAPPLLHPTTCSHMTTCSARLLQTSTHTMQAVSSQKMILKTSFRELPLLDCGVSYRAHAFPTNSMPVAHELQSRRSHSQLHTYLPSSPSSTSLTSFRHPDDERVLSNPGTNTTRASSQSQHLAGLLNGRNGSTRSKSRSPSPTNVRAPSRIPGPNRARSRSGGNELNGEQQGTADKEVQWETLQVAKPVVIVAGGKKKGSSKQPLATSTSLPLVTAAAATRPPPADNFSRSRTTVAFPFNPKSARTAPRTSTTTATATPRKRAQTQNWNGPRPANHQQRTASSSSDAPATRKTKPTTTKPKARLRSFSASHRGPDESDLDPSPPWISNAPLVFRSEITGQLESTGRLDDLVLPGGSSFAANSASLKGKLILAGCHSNDSRRSSFGSGAARSNGRTRTDQHLGHGRDATRRGVQPPFSAAGRQGSGNGTIGITIVIVGRRDGGAAYFSDEQA
jgi:hypothetical protein